MRKLSINKNLFSELLGWAITENELESCLLLLKAELAKRESWPEASSVDLEIFAKDEGRPDLWTSAGMARQLRIFMGHKMPFYPFFYAEEDEGQAVCRIVSDSSIKKNGNFLAGFLVSGKEINRLLLQDFLHSRNQLAGIAGKHGQALSAGLAYAGQIMWPLSYKAAEMDGGRSVLRDAQGKPVVPMPEEKADFTEDINSVPSPVLVYVYAGDLRTASMAINIFACDFADLGFEIQPVRVDYPFESEFGRTPSFPCYFQRALSIDSSKLSAVIGESISPMAIVDELQKSGIIAETHGQHVRAWPPGYRYDLNEAADLMEEVLISKSLSGYSINNSNLCAMGSLLRTEQLKRALKEIMSSLGFQEMLHSYCGSFRFFADSMLAAPELVIKRDAPGNPSYDCLRPGLAACLLESESRTESCPWPHKIFEIGRVFYNSFEDGPAENTDREAKMLCREHLGILLCHDEACFAELAALLDSFFLALGRNFAFVDYAHPGLEAGRQAGIQAGNDVIGVIGEVPQKVLGSLKINKPCVVCELDISFLQ